MSVTFCTYATSCPASRQTRLTRSNAIIVAAWPRCVASYGVMPQTYIVRRRRRRPASSRPSGRLPSGRRRDGPCRTGRQARGPGPGRRGSPAPAIQESMTATAGQMGGQGTAGHPGAGSGNTPSASRRSTRAAVASTSSARAAVGAAARPSAAGQIVADPGQHRARLAPAAAGRPSPTAPCAACRRRGSTRRGPRRTGARRRCAARGRPCGRRC